MKIQAFILSTALIVPMTVAAQSKIDSNNSAQLSPPEQHFLQKLASEDHSEIALAMLALNKSTNPMVQHYAKTILIADPPMAKQAKQIAQQDHATIHPGPTQKEKQEYKKLSQLSGKQFDREYMQYESRKQTADLSIVKSETATATTPEVRNYAVKEETPVMKAAQSANRIAHTLKVS